MTQLGLQLDSNANRIIQRFERMPKAVQLGVAKGLQRGLLLADARVRRNTEVKMRRGAAGLGGRLTNYVTVKAGLGIEAAIGFRKTQGFPYELSQEFGAKAKPGKAMAIPVSREARQAGSPRNMPDLALIKGKRRVVLVTKGGKGRMRVHYVLVKAIKPRLKFRENVKASVPEISREVVNGAKEGMGDA
jgi:hypothetical protein